MNPEEYLREEYGITTADDPQPVSLIHDMMYSYYHFHMCETEFYTKEQVKDELTKFLDFLLKNGYCDSDVYSEPPSAIDRYMHPELNR